MAKVVKKIDAFFEDRKHSKDLNAKSDDFDLIGLIGDLWNARKVVFKITIIMTFIGLFVAIFSPKEYVSSTVLVPQTSETKKIGGLSGLAAMAGLNMGDLGAGGDVLSPTIYPMILSNAKFQKDLMQTKIKLADISREITLYEYYSNPEFQKTNLISTFLKYTIGLPSQVIKWIKGDKDTSLTIDGNRYAKDFLQFTNQEYKVSKQLSKTVNLVVDEKEGILVLSANMPEALAAAQVAESARLLLQKYIIDFKIDKLKQNLEFLEKRCLDARREYYLKQLQLASFVDANRNVILASSRTTQVRLENEFNLANSIYSELSMQLEKAKIKVKDSSPVLTVVQPSVVPNKRTKPKRFMILFTFAFLGVFFSSSYVIGKKVLLKN